MGEEIVNVVSLTANATLSGAVVERGDPKAGSTVPAVGIVYGTDIVRASEITDVGIDFTSPASSIAVAEAFARAGKPLVVGTTGFSGPEKERILSHSRTIPILLSPNMSLGVHLLAHLVALAAKTLEGFDGEIVEIHHRLKKDAPSGTALFLGEALARARGKTFSEVGLCRREGVTGPRTKDEVGIMALRGGDVVGDHTVHFLGEGERIELTHRATSRSTFARGAVTAALFLAGKPAGIYSMNDVLGLPSDKEPA
jgi:4-hydroxy-tetrahydrodipicolinate reductase